MTDMAARGTSRFVFFVGRWAFKVPRCYSWKTFLWGLLANMQEREFGRTGWPELASVDFSLPGGFLVVMRRAQTLTDVEFDENEDRIIDAIKGGVPAEMKTDSWGWLNGRLVAVDYG